MGKSSNQVSILVENYFKASPPVNPDRTHYLLRNQRRLSQPDLQRFDAVYAQYQFPDLGYQRNVPLDKAKVFLPRRSSATRHRNKRTSRTPAGSIPHTHSQLSEPLSPVNNCIPGVKVTPPTAQIPYPPVHWRKPLATTEIIECSSLSVFGELRHQSCMEDMLGDLDIQRGRNNNDNHSSSSNRLQGEVALKSSRKFRENNTSSPHLRNMSPSALTSNIHSYLRSQNKAESNAVLSGHVSSVNSMYRVSNLQLSSNKPGKKHCQLPTTTWIHVETMNSPTCHRSRPCFGACCVLPPTLKPPSYFEANIMTCPQSGI